MSTPMTTPHLPGKFIWFEHFSPDVGAARAFYEPLFGWHVESMPMGNQAYPLILCGGQGIGGFGSQDAAQGARWLSHLSVNDVDRAFETAMAAGAQALVGPTDYPPVGRGARIRDPGGAEVSLWKSTHGDRPDPVTAPFGDWLWNELWTTDGERAIAFYEKVAGFGHERMPMAEGGSYIVLKSPDGKGRAGIFESTDRRMPALWMPYVHVEDCEASAEKARTLGANVFMPATLIDGVGRIASMFDPQGAAIAIMTPLPR